MLALDTHSFLWAAFEPARLSARGRRLLQDSANEVIVSGISLWEISLKFSLGKLQLTGCTPDELPGAAEKMGFVVVSPAASEFASFHRLPRNAHKDPFDRMITWQCLANDWTLLTRDAALPSYKDVGLRTVW